MTYTEGGLTSFVITWVFRCMEMHGVLPCRLYFFILS